MPEAFRFGENWERFLDGLGSSQVAAAKASLSALLGDLQGLRFLDVGSGSGLMSLAARELGAEILSFDVDERPTLRLKERFRPGDPGWKVEKGSVLDEGFLRGLGDFDVVYAWGSLHHTGAMWAALGNAASRVKPGGRLAVSLYHDQGWISGYWKGVKRLYGRFPGTMIALHLPYLATRWLSRAATGRLALERGMSLWTDYVDWLGGWPFETARPEEAVRFLEARGFRLLRQNLVKGRRHGCDEFLLESPPCASTTP